MRPTYHSMGDREVHFNALQVYKDPSKYHIGGYERGSIYIRIHNVRDGKVLTFNYLEGGYFHAFSALKAEITIFGDRKAIGLIMQDTQYGRRPFGSSDENFYFPGQAALAEEILPPLTAYFLAEGNIQILLFKTGYIPTKVLEEHFISENITVKNSVKVYRATFEFERACRETRYRNAIPFSPPRAQGRKNVHYRTAGISTTGAFPIALPISRPSHYATAQPNNSRAEFENTRVKNLANSTILDDIFCHLPTEPSTSRKDKTLPQENFENIQDQNVLPSSEVASLFDESVNAAIHAEIKDDVSVQSVDRIKKAPASDAPPKPATHEFKIRALKPTDSSLNTVTSVERGDFVDHTAKIVRVFGATFVHAAEAQVVFAECAERVVAPKAITVQAPRASFISVVSATIIECPRAATIYGSVVNRIDTDVD